ncbi:MAG: helix-turn-helix transcriptional regulator [Acidobacteria bacterium]|nr:helix-turn-helix transcriptional regulator [Acidobacteriota bacterium]
MGKKKKPASEPISSTTVTASQKQQIRNNVRKLRQERKWTQWQLAQISRLSQRTIQRIERGARIGITAELALSSAFEVEIPSLYASAPPGKGAKRTRDAPKSFRMLKRLVMGAALLDVIDAKRMRFELGWEPEQSQRRAVGDFLQHIHVWVAAGREMESIDRAEVARIFQTKLDELDNCGVYVFGARSSGTCHDETNNREGLLVFRRAEDPQISQPKSLRQFGKAMCFITLPIDTASKKP